MIGSFYRFRYLQWRFLIFLMIKRFFSVYNYYLMIISFYQRRYYVDHHLVEFKKLGFCLILHVKGAH